jgi:hypothetical protein
LGYVEGFISFAAYEPAFSYLFFLVKDDFLRRNGVGVVCGGEEESEFEGQLFLPYILILDFSVWFFILIVFGGFRCRCATTRSLVGGEREGDRAIQRRQS